jgi:hypothetical protein
MVQTHDYTKGREVPTRNLIEEESSQLPLL